LWISSNMMEIQFFTTIFGLTTEMVIKSERFILALLIYTYADSDATSCSLGSNVCFISSTHLQYGSNSFINLRGQHGFSLGQFARISSQFSRVRLHRPSFGRAIFYPKACQDAAVSTTPLKNLLMQVCADYKLCHIQSIRSLIIRRIFSCLDASVA
jgi:hypothetical protein